VKSYHFLTCFVTFAKEIVDAARFAEYVGRNSSNRVRSLS